MHGLIRQVGLSKVGKLGNGDTSYGPRFVKIPLITDDSHPVIMTNALFVSSLRIN